ncbi:MAG: carboxypeptidase-like regulatory domain-containing protein [Bacteroidia bacterium]|nr:carboxypeptidase-like regulatory domain-containing protein [Bacteroidia bacterium]
MNRLIYTIAFFILTFLDVYGQTNERERFVQVSGIITDESYKAVPGVAVISKKLRRGTISERTGIYSITSTPGDTIFFRALGFKRYHTIIPVSYEERHCNVDIALEIDTIPIEEITILPWKSYNDFIKDITKEKPVDPIIENMNDNIASIYIALANQTGVRISPEAGYRYAMEQNFSALTTKNQYPVNNLLNPFAWAKFINGIKNGLFKNQKFNKPVNAKVRKIKKKSENK